MIKLTIATTIKGSPLRERTVYHLLAEPSTAPITVLARCDNQEHARRLTACWNACDNIPDNMLKPDAMFNLGYQLTEARDQRDKLLAAMLLLDDAYAESENLPASGLTDKEITKRWRAVRAAITEVTTITGEGA